MNAHRSQCSAPGVATLEGTLADRRAAVLASLEGVDADTRMSFSVVGGRGAWRHADFTCSGDQHAASVFHAVDGAPFCSPWDPELPPARAVNRFQPGIDGWADSEEALACLPVWRTFYGPGHVRWDRRMLVYDGDVFVAWLSVGRLADRRPFGPEDDGPLARAASRARRLAIAHYRESGARLPEGTGHLIVSATGAVELACGLGAAWLDAAGRAWIAEATRRVDQGDAIDRVVGGGIEARPVRLAGDGGCRYLWLVDRVERVRRSPLALLSPRLRDVAGIIAAGATVGETARHLGLSPETVRAHLRAVYSRLEVGSRIELSRILAQHVVP